MLSKKLIVALIASIVSVSALSVDLAGTARADKGISCADATVSLLLVKNSLYSTRFASKYPHVSGQK